VSESLLHALVFWLIVVGWAAAYAMWTQARFLRRMLAARDEDYERRGKIIRVLWDVVYGVGGAPAVEAARRRLGAPEGAISRDVNVN
jgi:hypothetical protein